MNLRDLYDFKINAFLCDVLNLFLSIFYLVLLKSNMYVSGSF